MSPRVKAARVDREPGVVHRPPALPHPGLAPLFVPQASVGESRRRTAAPDDYERSANSRHRDARSPGGTTLSSSLTSGLVEGRCLGTRAGPTRPSSLAQWTTGGSVIR